MIRFRCRLSPFSFIRATHSSIFNYAIPDEACGGDLGAVFQALRKAYQERGRRARLEFFEAFAPDLPAALRANGFIEEARQWSMLCTPSSLLPVPPVNGLSVTDLGPETSWTDARDFICVQQEGFNPQGGEDPTEAEIRRRLDRLQSGGCRAFLGRIDGEPAGVAEFGQPIDGVTEITGIATRPKFRRRGIAAWLTARALRSAFSLGVRTVCLTAADENAGRVYAKAGFVPFSIMLAYIDFKLVRFRLFLSCIRYPGWRSHRSRSQAHWQAQPRPS